ncbi:girdin [Neocloeon triangulifer]|uniref:girdin n=1 Tax=Neocloeon triangulifer TaxID=2078957 RepID=UPI00286F284B|nr:girdin [Neocloeon triangulifer]
MATSGSYSSLIEEDNWDNGSEANMARASLMNGHLVFWLKSCLVDSDLLQNFEDLIDGPLLYEVLQRIDPDGNPSTEVQESHGDPTVRLKNLDIVVNGLKVFYEKEGQGSVLLSVPDVSLLAVNPDDGDVSVTSEARLLLVLLLGAAVQCQEKENFILKLKSLPVDVQLKIVENIKEVTEEGSIVLSGEQATDQMSSIYKMAKDRDRFMSQYIKLLAKDGREDGVSRRSMSVDDSTNAMHHVVEIAEWKSKLRRRTQELEEKGEALMECREELESMKEIVGKLKQEVSDLSSSARSAKLYRDELDAARLKAERCERVEAELGRARDKLRDLEYLKSLTSELQSDNRLLVDRTQDLEEQLSRARARSEAIIDLEAQIARLKQSNNDGNQDREELQEKIRDLTEENTQLQLRQLSLGRSDPKNASQELDPNLNDGVGSGGSLLDQLQTSAQSEVVKLKMENSRMRAELDSLKENLSLETASLQTALDNEKKKSALKVEELLSSERVHRQLQSTLEDTVRELTNEKKELGSQLQDSAIQSQKLATELQESKQHIVELSDKVSHLESVHRANGVLWEAERTKHTSGQREIVLLRTEKERALENLATKSALLDAEISKRREFEGKATELKAALKVAKDTIQRSSELEQQMNETISQRDLLNNSLKDLQNKLTQEKIDKEKLNSQLDSVFSTVKQIANCENIDRITLTDYEAMLTLLAQNPELINTLKEKQKGITEGGVCVETPTEAEIQAEVDANNKMQEIAELQVKISLLESQIASLLNQQTAQQLANTQLAAEKEELCHQLENQVAQNSQLAQDMANLQKIHETLSMEYEAARNERESTRSELKAAQKELKVATAEINALKITNQDQELLRIEAKTLANLRAEHSKLKEDFRQLFSASERLKMEARSRDDELRRTRVELGTARINTRQLTTSLENEKEVNTRLSARLTRVDTKLQLLVGVAHSLEEDRRSLMSHVTSLLSQYHELLSNSMEDKEFFHSQEKIFLEKLNGLMRQKENLEQKIMDHYRRLDSCSTKKKGFGANLVKKVRKAGSDIISKVPRGRSRSRNTAEGADTSASSDLNTTHDSEHSSDETVSDHGSGLPLDSDTDTSLSTVGTRRAIYYDDDHPSSSLGEPLDNPTNDTKERNILVYNKISAVVGTTNNVQSPGSNHNNHDTPDQPKPESSIWYEYGCV